MLKVLLVFCLLFTNVIHAAHLMLGPLVGHTNANQTKIWLSLDSMGSVELIYADNKALENAQEITRKNFETGIIEISDLKPETIYYYKVKTNSVSSDIFSFKTTPIGLAPTKLRVLFSSCSGRLGINSEASWADISKKMDFSIILQLGDNHYADSTDPEIQKKHYHDHRTHSVYRNVTGNIPTYAIWDDHDFGPNNSDGQTSGKELSLKTFKEYWANPSYGEATNPGIYYSFYYGNIHFIMLDSRYHRDPNNSKKADDPSKKFLGERQLEWLKETLKNSQGKVKIIGCGSEFQLNSSSDCLTGFKHEQKILLDLFRDTEGVLLISGDRHFTAAYQIRGETIEVTSGPLGSKSYENPIEDDQFLKMANGKFYSIFDIDTEVSPPQISLEVYQTGKGQVYKRSFSWDEINGKKRIESLKK
jgi:alkaline phosphatase D